MSDQIVRLDSKRRIRSKKYVLVSWTTNSEQTEINNTEIPYIIKVKPIRPKLQKNKKKDIKIKKKMKYRLQNLTKKSSIELANFSTIHRSDKHIKKNLILITSRSTRTLYFMMIRQCGGGQSYHDIQYIYVGVDKNQLISQAEDYIDNQHRQQDCKNYNDDCVQEYGSCENYKKQLISDLKINNSCSVSIVSGSGEQAGIDIYPISIYRPKMQQQNQNQEVMPDIQDSKS